MLVVTATTSNSSVWLPYIIILVIVVDAVKVVMVAAVEFLVAEAAIITSGVSKKREQVNCPSIKWV